MAPKVRGVAEKLRVVAESFHESVMRNSLAAFTSGNVGQLQAALDELVEILDVKVSPQSTAEPGVSIVVNILPEDVPQVDANEPVDVRKVVVDVMRAVDEVLQCVKNSPADLVSRAAGYVTAFALHKNKILYVAQVVAAQAAATCLEQVALRLQGYRSVEVVAKLRVATEKVSDATKKVLGVLDDVPADPTATVPHVDASAAIADVIKAAQEFQSLGAQASNNVDVTVKGKQYLLCAVTELRVATHKAQLYVKVEIAKSLSQEVQNAATEFSDSVNQKGLAAAYTDIGISRLRSATSSLLAGLNLPAAATELTYDAVNILSALDEIKCAASGFHSVRSDEEFPGLLVRIRAATDTVLLGNKILGAAQEVLEAAHEFRNLVKKDRHAEDSYVQTADAIEKIRGAVDKVPGPEPKVSCAVNEVLRAAEAIRNRASELKEVDRVEVGEKLTKFHETLNEASLYVGEDSNENAYKEAVNLSLIKLDQSPKYPVHKAALEHWEQKDKESFNCVVHTEVKSNNVINQVLNIIGLYAVFLGVILSTVSQLTQAESDTSMLSLSKVNPFCGKYNLLFPKGLTIFGMLLTIAGVCYKYQQVKGFEQSIFKHKKVRHKFKETINTLRRKGPESFSFTTDVRHDVSHIKLRSFARIFFAFILALICLTVLFILSYDLILCKKLVA